MGQIIANLVAVAGFFLAIYAAITARRALGLQRASHGAVALYDLVAKEYLDRTFEATEAPKYKYKKAEKTRPLKEPARKELKYSQSTYKSAVLERGTWQNSLAFEISVALERLGIATFSGVLPVKLVLPLAGDQMLDDWTLCYDWIVKYREDQGTEDSSGSIPFHRRHGEWVVLLAAIWMSREFPTYPPLREIDSLYGSHDALRQQFVLLTKCQEGMLGMNVKSELEKVFGGPLWDEY